MRCAPRLLVILLLLPACAGADEGTTTLTGVWTLDTEDLAQQLVREAAQNLDPALSDLPEDQQRYVQETEVARAEKTARGWSLVLDLGADGRFSVLGRSSAPSLGSHPACFERAGTWSVANGKVRLEPEDVEPRRQYGIWLSEPVTCSADADTLRLPALHFRPDSETTFLFRRQPDLDRALLSMSPKARAARVRASLPAPHADGAFTFRGEIIAWFGSAARAGTLEVSVQPDLHEGRPAWRVEETWDRPVQGEWKRTVAMLAADLGILDQQTETKRQETLDPADVAGDRKTSLTATEQGYLHSSQLGAGVRREWNQVTDERPFTTVAAHLLFLRGCSDLPVEYELTCWGEAEILGPRITIHGPDVVPGLGGEDTGRSAWAASSTASAPESRGGTGVYLAPEDREPLAILTGFGSRMGGGLFAIAAPGVFRARDLLRLGPEVWRAGDAAARFAVGTVWWDPELIDSVLDWQALYDRAEARGFAGDEQAFRSDLLGKLERRSRALLLAEGNEIVQAVTRRDGKEQPAGEIVHVVSDARAAEFAVQARNTAAGWKVVALHDCIHAETRALDDEWADAKHPEPVYGGRRLWMWARRLRAGDPGRDAAAVLHRMGPLAWPVLAKLILQIELGGAGKDARRAWSGPRHLLRASVPALLLAYEQAGPSDRAALLAALKGRIHRYGRNPMPVPGRGLPQPVPDRHPAAVPILLRALAAESSDLRALAAMRLQDYGALARRAAPALEAALQDEDEAVRQAATHALAGVRRREVEIRFADRLWFPDAFLYRGALAGEPLLRIDLLEERAHGLVLAGEFGPGRYTVCVVGRYRAPLVLSDVEVAEPLTRIGPVSPPAGARILVRVTKRAGAPKASDLHAQATHLGEPAYERRGIYVVELGAQLLQGLGPGSFRVLVMPAGGENTDQALLDQVVECDGKTQIELEVEVE